MNRSQIVLFAILLSSIRIGKAAQPFVDASFVILANVGTDNFLYEYDLSGNKLQEIALPSGTTSSNRQISLDATGSLLVVPLVAGSESRIYTYNANGAYVDTTVVTSGASVQFGMMSGQDVWMGSGSAVSYTSRGTSVASPTNANIIPGSSLSLDAMQLVGGQLYYVKQGSGLMVMDPIATTSTGTETQLLPVQEKIYVYKSALYVYNGGSLKKYIVQNGQATLKYTTAASMTTVQSITVVESTGLTFLVVCGISGSSTYVVKRYTDTGSSFIGETTVIDTLAFTTSSITPSPIATCTDGFKDQDETDVDCGGVSCDSCADTKTCLKDDDCSSGYCNGDKVCATPTCDDSVKNQDESDIDCGGTKCNKCDDGKVCKVLGDCTSGVCSVDGLCAVPACDDTVMNGNETDVDCGGPFCSGCALNKTCTGDNDCSSFRCVNNLCAESCQDKIQNQDETDVDCGGSMCSKCAIGSRCKVNSDCQNNFCDGIVCTIPVSPPQTVDTPVSATTGSSPIAGSDIPVKFTPGSSTPIKQKPTSAGAVTEVFVLGMLVAALVV